MKFKENEVPFFVDFNNTIVDYENECNFLGRDTDFALVLRTIKKNVSRALMGFEKETGLTPVIFVITNATLQRLDENDYNGICYDVMKTYFDHEGMSNEEIEQEIQSSSEKYKWFLLHKENEGYFEINPRGKDMDEMFIPALFSDETQGITESSKKKETVARIINEFGPVKSGYAVFAGDSIKDDYPMKYAINDSGVSRIFIRPKHCTNLKPNIMAEFALAKGGISFDCVNPKNGKKVKSIDETTIKFLNEEQLNLLNNYNDGEPVLLTNANTRGFIEGIYQTTKIIQEDLNSNKERPKD